MRKLILISFLMVVAAKAVAQQTMLKNEPDNRVTIRMNFMGLLDAYDLHIPIGAEYRIDNRWSTGIDLGYIFYSEYLPENEGTSGWLFRPFARIYNAHHPNRFFEVRIHYKTVDYRTTDWIDRDIVDGTASYQEYATETFRKRVLGLDIMNGRAMNLSRNERLKMEIYFGIGFRWKRQGIKNGRLSNRSFGFANYRAPEFVYPSLPMGAWLTFAL